MTTELTQYLENIKYQSKLEHSNEAEVMSELEAHIEDRVQELTDKGLTKEEAVKVCLRQMGGPKVVARQIYETYSQGTWKQVSMASMPHLIFGLLFALNWWHHAFWVTVTLLLVLAITVYGWYRGKPTWVFSWLGYSLLPVLAAGLLLLYLPKIWSLLTLLIYFPLALWWLFRVIVQTTKRDWIFCSLMLLPLPIVSGWLLAILPELKFAEFSLQRVYAFAPWIGLSFMALGLTIAAFIRVRQRWLRISLLATSGLVTLSLVIYYTTGRLNTITFLGLMLVMWGVLVLPPLLERFLRSGRKLTWVHKERTDANIKRPV